MLECLLSLILGIEARFKPFYNQALPEILDSAKNSQLEWNARKMAIDVIYTLSVVLPEALEASHPQICLLLNTCRFDKVKFVREAAVLAINLLKQMGYSCGDIEPSPSQQRHTLES